MSDKIKVYITKFALTAGILTRMVSVRNSMVTCRTDGGFQEHFHGEGKEWHRTYEGAAKRAEEMRLAKIDSLRKSLAKMEALTFPQTEPK